MPVTVIIGGQFGGEGKGKVACFFAQEKSAKIVVRVGGTNSGHTVVDQSGLTHIFRQLPTAAILQNVICILSAGSYINPKILFDEISKMNLSPKRLYIDPNACLITERELKEEKNSLLRKSIGSTLSGTGAAVKRRIERDQSVRLAKDEECLRDFIKPVVPFLREKLLEGERIIVEGTQGFGLSLLHSKYYPYVTSRDTSAAAFISEAGLSPFDVDEIVMVLRAYPIRVGGNSGPLLNEIEWKIITNESGDHNPIFEYTSVTKTLRRVARFDPDIVKQAIMINKPSCIVLNHLDYIDISCRNSDFISKKIYRFVNEVESNIKTKIDYYGLGPSSLITSHEFVTKEERYGR